MNAPDIEILIVAVSKCSISPWHPRNHNVLANNAPNMKPQTTHLLSSRSITAPVAPKPMAANKGMEIKKSQFPFNLEKQNSNGSLVRI
jgi:hypothetical protein